MVTFFTYTTFLDSGLHRTLRLVTVGTIGKMTIVQHRTHLGEEM